MKSCALILLSLISLEARRLPIRTYTTADGLARDRVQCILQDHHGFLWFCTSEGLSRFDGYQFTNYGLDWPRPANNITALSEARDGFYWLGTRSGVKRFDPAAPAPAKFQPYSLPGDQTAQSVTALLEDRAGAIWCGTSAGLFRLSKSNSAFERIDLGPAAQNHAPGVDALLEDRRGSLWIGTDDGLYRRNPDGHATYFSVGRVPQGVLALLEDRDGTMWAGTTSSLWRIDNSGHIIDCQVNQRIFALLQTSGGTIWTGGSGGLGTWIPQTGALDVYKTASGLAASQVGSLFEDRDGNMWIGSDGAGVMRMARSGLVSYYPEEGLGPSPERGTFLETRDGERCFRTGAGISRFDGRRFSPMIIAFPPGITSFGWGAGRLALQDRSREWWFATAQGLCRFPAVPLSALARTAPKAIYRKLDGLAGDNIFQIFETSTGDIWIGIGDPSGGIGLWEKSTGRIRTFPDTEGFDMVSGFAEDHAGNIWIGCYHGGLVRYRAGRFTDFGTSPGVPGGGWKVPFIDSCGRLWIAATRGLGRTDEPAAGNPRFITYTTRHGLSSNDIKSIAEDRTHQLYVATGRGLDRVKPLPENIAVTRHYTNADGLAGGELRSAWSDSRGDLWFATNVGLSQLTPTEDRSPQPPPVLLTGMQSGAAALAVADTGQSDVRGPNIQPGQGPLRLDFVGLSFAPGETLRYQYQLAGVDPDWSAPTDQRTVLYGRLSSGTYRFRVRAINSEGMPSAQPATAVFTVLPPIWMRWWFLSSSALAFAGLIYAGHHYRVRQVVALERVRTRIATDLHDDIGSSLSQISILSELVRQRLDTTDPRVSQPLTEIAAVSSEMVAALSDIVWAINPRHDRLNELAARMRRFALDVLGARGIELEFEADPHPDHLRTSSDFRRQVYLIFKEAVNNAARHAACTRAHIRLRIWKGRLEMQLNDNGRGFHVSSAGSGNGLANMRSRAGELDGIFILDSAPGAGTGIRLSVPLPHSRTQ